MVKRSTQLSVVTDAPVGCAEDHLLKVEGVHVHYGSICALRDVSFEMHCGHALALLGRNGAGKSTLLKAIAGLQEQMLGSITWNGKSLKNFRHEVAYLPQREDVDWNFPLTLRGLVETGRYPHLGLWKRFSPDDERIVNESIKALDLWDLQHRQISQLSGGQQQRAFIARALAQEAHVFLLDEPYAGLDQPASEKLSHLLKKLVGGGRLVIASHHDLKTVEANYDLALMLNETLISFGPVSEAFHAETIRQAYAS